MPQYIRAKNPGFQNKKKSKGRDQDKEILFSHFLEEWLLNDISTLILKLDKDP